MKYLCLAYYDEKKYETLTEAEALQLLAAVSARAGRVQIAQTYQAQAAALARELRMDPRRFPPVLAS